MWYESGVKRRTCNFQVARWGMRRGGDVRIVVVVWTLTSGTLRILVTCRQLCGQGLALGPLNARALLLMIEGFANYLG